MVEGPVEEQRPLQLKRSSKLIRMQRMPMTSIDRLPRVSGHLLESRDQELDDGCRDATASSLPTNDLYLYELPNL